MNTLKLAALAAALVVLCPLQARADQFRFVFGLDGAQETPPVATSAGGSGTATLGAVSGTMRTQAANIMVAAITSR